MFHGLSMAHGLPSSPFSQCVLGILSSAAANPTWLEPSASTEEHHPGGTRAVLPNKVSCDELCGIGPSLLGNHAVPSEHRICSEL
jgi:hypothetical protein